MANLLGEPYDDYVSSQIKARQRVYGSKNRTIEQISYLNSTNAWIKLASGVSIDKTRLAILRQNNNQMALGVGEGQELAMKNVLFNGLTEYENSSDSSGVIPKIYEGIGNKGRVAYGLDGTDFGYSPMPGIIDLSVKDLNRGSIKKATLNIKANNRNQLEIIDCLYMRLGYTVLLEWGHNQYWDDRTNSLVNQPASLIDTDFFKTSNSKSDYTKFLPKIQSHRELTRGNYDAMFGTVSNFSWTFEPDGSYNCKIEIISLGDIIESLNINISTGGDELAKTQSLKANSSIYATSIARSSTEFYKNLYPTLENDLKTYFDNIILGLNQGELSIRNYFKVSETFQTTEDDRFGNGGIGPNGQDEIPYGYLKFKATEGFEFVNSNETPTETSNETEVDSNEELSEADKELAKDKELQNANIKFVFDQGVMGQYMASVLTKTFEDNGQLEITLSGPGTNTQSLISVKKRGKDTGLIDLLELPGGTPVFLKDEKYTPDNSNNFTGYDPRNLRGKVLINYATSIQKPADKLQLGLPIGFLQLTPTFDIEGAEKIIGRGEKYLGIGGVNAYSGTVPVPESDVVTFNGPKGGQDAIFNPIAKQILAKLLDFEEFKQFTFERFAEFNRAGGAGDPRFNSEPATQEELDAENENIGENQLEEFLTLAQEKRVRGNYFKYFYNIRTLYTPVAEASEVQKETAEDYNGNKWFYQSPKFPLNDIVTFQGLKGENNNIQCFGLTVGYILNPIETSESELVQNWNNKVKYPKYIEKLSPPSGIKYVPHNEKNEKIGEAGVDFFKLNITNIDQSFYIRFGTLLSYLRDKSIPGIDSSGNPPMIKIDAELKNNVCYVIDNVISNNPTKIIVNNHMFFQGDTTSTEIYTKLNRFIEGDSKKGYYGNLMNVYFNFSRIEEILEKQNKNGDLPLFDFIDTLCQDINECLGHVNNLEPVVDKIFNEIKIIDQTAIPNAKELFPELDDNEQAVLEVFGYNNDQSNFVHNIGITTQISKEYATMITIGATSKGAVPGAEATAFSKWNIGIEDRFKNNLTAPETPTTSTSSSLAQLNEDNKAVIQNYTNFITRNFSSLGFSETQIGDDSVTLTLNSEYVKNNSEVCKNFYIYEQARATLGSGNTNSGVIESSVGFIPFNLKVDMEGMSGFKIYNRLKVNTNFLPSNYDKTLDFIITGVNHTVSNNHWKTNLDSLATSKSVLGGK